MPLPDERPRGSVANLIGRFENQVKRRSSSSPASARSLSATSHVSGDSAKEEAKEQREWPPKSSSPDVRLPITIPSSSFARSLAIAQSVSIDAILGTPATHAQADVQDASLTPRPRSTTSNPDKPKPVITTPPQRQLSIDVIAPTPTASGTPTTAKPPTIAKSSPPKMSAQATGRPSTITSARTPVRPTGIRPSTIPAAHPTKPQNPGPNNSARKPVTKPTPSTSSSTSRTTATPASTRPRTPSSTRSKTPSSGLFAPTAASLAKSRNAQPPLPTPTKKVTLSSAVAERLSKPTAASLSRTRTPTAAASHTGAKPASASPATRGAPAIKSKASTTGTPAKKPGVTPIAKKAAGAATGAGAGAAIEPGSVSEEVVVPPEENGYRADENQVDEHPEDAINSEGPLPEQENSIPVESTEAEAEAKVATTNVDEHLNGKAIEANNETDVVTASLGDKSESYDNPLEHSEPEPTPLKGPEAHVGNEIEDMVNLLESVSISKVRPESIASIPDEE